MKNSKRLSVIVPVYNVEQYLKRCVDSILNQTVTDLEIILVDDGSTDGSGAMCDAYAKKMCIRDSLHAGLFPVPAAGAGPRDGQYRGG